METLALEKLYPDLFEGLSREQIRDINISWAYEWHAGWQPNREDVELSLKVTRGEITHEECRALIIAEAKQWAS